MPDDETDSDEPELEELPDLPTETDTLDDPDDMPDNETDSDEPEPEE